MRWEYSPTNLHLSRMLARRGDVDIALTVDGKAITYRQAKVQERPLLGAPAPNATAPPAVAAVVGKAANVVRVSFK